MKYKLIILFLILSLLECSCTKQNKKKETTENITCSAEVVNHDITLGGDKNPNITVESIIHEETMEDNKKISIQYPEITGLNPSFSDNVNELIKNEALSVYTKSNILNNNDMSFLVEYEWYANKDVLSIKFKALYFVKGTAHPTDVISTLNVNLKNGKKIRFTDLYKVNEDMEACLYNQKDREDVDGKDTFTEKDFKPYTKEKVLEVLQDIDTTSYIGNTDITIYSYYEKNHLLIITVHGIRGAGDYNQMIVPYEDIEKLRLN
ncbi:hypothetical protein M2475_002094 [Breznakia sp. PF5-3]|uniref:hypothetical protein n=1 Tax=unclassified Breznakia TaxID=2623764 RepID=UPI00240599B7|nr:MULTISPECIES: hypothetical protein [unclassified Breznakia]MDF9825676.1 hypothetical protein [Breznakia sp. PM6-1]MDF9836513.1 hypothetical protein [Breznakia sp. PF5-3]MDF9837816.1 hypothetical protein [Breznakia sp. PFB2-8]MDF9859736.1 hypothetical protein [Breznakia sp. PH5-24]